MKNSINKLALVNKNVVTYIAIYVLLNSCNVKHDEFNMLVLRPNRSCISQQCLDTIIYPYHIDSIVYKYKVINDYCYVKREIILNKNMVQKLDYYMFNSNDSCYLGVIERNNIITKQLYTVLKDQDTITTHFPMLYNIKDSKMIYLKDTIITIKGKQFYTHKFLGQDINMFTPKPTDIYIDNKMRIIKLGIFEIVQDKKGAFIRTSF